MSRRLAFLLLLTSSAVAGGATNSNPLGLRDLKIIWAVPTNVWPPSADKIWTYKVVPQEFPAAVISNLMALGPFSEKDRLTPSPASWLETDRKAFGFGQLGKKYLEVLPTLGYIEFLDESALAREASSVPGIPESIIGIPSEQEAAQLGLKYVRLAGIDVSQLSTKPGTVDLDLHWWVGSRGRTDQKTGIPIKEVMSRSVEFNRRIDGIRVTNFGDVSVEFGNNAKVHRFKVSWRKLEPYELRGNFVTPEQVIKLIRSGVTEVPLGHYSPEQIRSLTITNAEPRYSKHLGFRPLDFVRPALQLDALIDIGTTNKYFWFQSAIYMPEGRN